MRGILLQGLKVVQNRRGSTKDITFIDTVTVEQLLPDTLHEPTWRHTARTTPDFPVNSLPENLSRCFQPLLLLDPLELSGHLANRHNTFCAEIVY